MPESPRAGGRFSDNNVDEPETLSSLTGGIVMESLRINPRHQVLVRDQIS